MKILVVDDNHTFLDKMEKLLQLEKHSVVTVSSGEEALEVLLQKNFDLLLTDLKMNEISGIDLIKEISKANIDLISIVITGYGTIDSAVEAMKSGAYDYILKPFDFSGLKEKLTEVEMELKLRKTIFPETLRSNIINEVYKEKIDINEYQNPFLIISNEDPENIITENQIDDFKVIRFGFLDSIDVIPPSKLHILRKEIENFVNSVNGGTIIIKGIEDLLITHKWDNFKRFLLYLQQKVISSKFHIVVILDNKTSEYKDYQAMLHDALSLLSIQAFNDILSVVSHDLRRNTINLLKAQGGLNFNKIAAELSVENSSILAFHIKKLVQESLLEKKDNLYSLSIRGHYFAEIIYNLEKIGVKDPSSKVKVVRY